jgi:Arc/MetJ family transcription regulator
MRTNIEIDDKLMKQAMKATGATTKRAAVEAALRKTVQLKRQARIWDWFGKVDWEGDLNQMRTDCPPEDTPAQNHPRKIAAKQARPKAATAD